MAVLFTDEEIAELITEPKLLQKTYSSLLRLKQKRGHKEQEIEIEGEEGNTFVLIFRQNSINPLNFSIVLAHRPENSNRLFRLRRYNGKHGEHTNSIEGNSFYDFHIHTATERYQYLGLREDTFAEPTGIYSDIYGAFELLLNECGFELSDNSQKSLF